MKQTAVDWLVEQLNIKYGNNDFIITHINEIQQAKEMEKQQKKKDFEKGYECGVGDYIDCENGFDCKSIGFEEYYNTEYGGEE